MNEKDMKRPHILNDLKLIHFDFEQKVFEINGHNVGFYNEVEISFRDGEWNVRLAENISMSADEKYVDVHQ